MATIAPSNHKITARPDQKVDLESLDETASDALKTRICYVSQVLIFLVRSPNPAYITGHKL